MSKKHSHPSHRIATTAVFLVGLAAVAWVGWGFVAGAHTLALTLTGLIAAVYLLGAHELRQYRQATATLSSALADVPQPLSDLNAWLARVHPGLQNPVRLRIEGERTALPGPALTPYLVGLLVMLGMLGTFLGMVVTFKGAVFALEGSADLAAIRAALAEPIKGLGLSFGTSVAGVAASAMLGLLSALSRRERLEAVRLLDVRIATVLRPFSAAHQREETFKALQVQAQALPQIADGLQAMMDGLTQRTELLSQQLRDQQAQFHGEASAAYQALAASVGASLKESLSASARLAGEAIQPVVASAMADITQAARLTHQQLIDATQAQVQGLATQWAQAAQHASGQWAQTAAQQAQANEALMQGLDGTLKGFSQHLEQHAQALLTSVQRVAEQAQQQQAAADEQRLAGLARAMSDMGETLSAQWQRAGTETLAQQQATCQALEAAASQVTERASAHVGQTLEGLAKLLSQSEELVRSRVASEAQWVASQGERMAELTAVWRAELSALRDQEAARGQAAVASLDGLHAKVAEHLASLGASLEAPMTRLLQTAAEVPQAAASVIAQLRQEMSRLSERDNAALAERTEIMGQLGTLLQGINQAALDQRTTIESLVNSAAFVLEQAGKRFADALGAQAGQVEEVAARVTASAVELASLGEAFHHGVDLFSASNDKLMDNLQRIEAAIGQSLQRSDDQLAYYVAQAREVIDLSISSQQGIVEDLRRLHAGSKPLPGAAAGTLAAVEGL
ncbi:MAG: DUF802 domain-containing protein [Aquabacterium sp.]